MVAVEDVFPNGWNSVYRSESTVSVPLRSYFLASFYTKYNPTHFVINTASLLSVLIPKLPQLHGVRLFGINKY